MFKIPQVVVLRSGALRETSYKDLSPSNKSFRELTLLSHLHLCHLRIWCSILSLYSLYYVGMQQQVSN